MRGITIVRTARAHGVQGLMLLARSYALRAAARLPGQPRHACPICGWTGPRFGPFLVMPEYVRPGAACPECGALERHRAVAPLIAEAIASQAWRGRKLDILHLTPEPPLASLIAPHARRYDRSQYERALLQPHEIHVDLCSTGLPDQHYDLIVANGILCSVLDLPAALDEVHRILRSGGVFVAHEVLVPTGRTQELPEWRPGDPIRPVGIRRILGMDDISAAARPLDARFVDLAERYTAAERHRYGFDSAGMAGLVLTKPPYPPTPLAAV